ncbi:immunity 8 family protein [Pseudomonas sp. OV226]|uniref:immunity 8 family protein n=1 Tax=Pseudomonas sp. OV226 TaxID=2135588 RepID=UPI000D6D1936|nr:immunity 8 family protein [Pseudomonas sp. OV226]PWK46011.1 immunity protein 8 of polymorphic toxin system [Pseudomonas sp. OV226]
MNAELKGVHSPDIYDLENYHPECSDNFGFLLQAMIGPAGEDGEESFDIEVCTPKWIEKNLGADEVLIGMHYLIVREYNYQKIVHSIETFLLNCSGANWSEVSRKVSRLGLWEFEGYDNGGL